jgi:transcriptional regulator with PAS, ATPase and Fis domain
MDEVGEMPKDAQVKLLRVLEEGEVRPVGSPTAVQVDVRLVSASNRPLAGLRAERLREDFYFRIATVVIEIPPLRARLEDVFALVQHFVGRLARQTGRQITVSRPALEVLLNHPYAGNIRELENVLLSATAVSLDDPQTITEKDLRPLLKDSGAPPLQALSGDQPLSMERLEQVAIQQALRLCEGNRTKAASLLGISRDTLYRKLRQAKTGV